MQVMHGQSVSVCASANAKSYCERIRNLQMRMRNVDTTEMQRRDKQQRIAFVSLSFVRTSTMHLPFQVLLVVVGLQDEREIDVVRNNDSPDEPSNGEKLGQDANGQAPCVGAVRAVFSTRFFAQKERQVPHVGPHIANAEIEHQSERERPDLAKSQEGANDEQRPQHAQCRPTDCDDVEGVFFGAVVVLMTLNPDVI